jgi:hypothetical protein
VRKSLVSGLSMLLVAAAAVGILALSPATAEAQATQRPIQDFVTPNLTGGDWSWYEPATNKYMYIDYFGRNNAAYNLNLGTTVDGTVTERPLRDGTAHVHVVMHAANALSYGWDASLPAPFANQLVFGHTVAQVLGGDDAGLGDVILTVDFINSAPGAPLPNITAVPLEKISMVVTADGTLRAAFGVPDGTPGMAHTTQRGLYTAPGLPNNGQDYFPAEHVDFWATGQ